MGARRAGVADAAARLGAGRLLARRGDRRAIDHRGARAHDRHPDQLPLRLRAAPPLRARGRRARARRGACQPRRRGVPLRARLSPLLARAARGRHAARLPGAIAGGGPSAVDRLLADDRARCRACAHHRCRGSRLPGSIVLAETGATALEVEDAAAGIATRVSVEGSAQGFPIWVAWSAAPDAPYVCLEPWTDAPNALNRPETRRIEAGATHRYQLKISARPI